MEKNFKNKIYSKVLEKLDISEFTMDIWKNDNNNKLTLDEVEEVINNFINENAFEYKDWELLNAEGYYLDDTEQYCPNIPNKNLLELPDAIFDNHIDDCDSPICQLCYTEWDDFSDEKIVDIFNEKHLVKVTIILQVVK